MEVPKPKWKKGMLERRERTALRALPEKRTIHSTTEAMLPRPDILLFLDWRTFQMRRVNWWTVCHAVRAWSSPELRV
jgi:hypothetical protein